MTISVADLMRRNLLDVFDERDPDRRAAAVAEIYAEDVVWHEPDRVNRGREALAERAAELQAETPGWVFQPVGPASALDDLGHLGFRNGPRRTAARRDGHGHRPLPGRCHRRALHAGHRGPSVKSGVTILV